jgi:cytochrome b561
MLGNRHSYGTTAKFLHWLVAVLIIALCVVGHAMGGLSAGPLRGSVYDVHKQLGVAVLLIATVRIVWRVVHGTPSLPVTMPLVERIVAKGAHLCLYALTLAMPLAGILMSQSSGRPVQLLGLPLPVLVDKDPVLKGLFETGHAALGWLIVIIVAGHVAAALRHHFILRDELLLRMLPGGRR